MPYKAVVYSLSIPRENQVQVDLDRYDNAISDRLNTPPQKNMVQWEKGVPYIGTSYDDKHDLHHLVSPRVDELVAQYGYQEKTQDGNTLVSLPMELIYTNDQRQAKIEIGVMQYIVSGTGLCYHRCFKGINLGANDQNGISAKLKDVVCRFISDKYYQLLAEKQKQFSSAELAVAEKIYKQFKNCFPLA